MNDNFAKLIVVAIVGGVAKALFSPVRPANTYITQAIDKLPAKDKELEA